MEVDVEDNEPQESRRLTRPTISGMSSLLGDSSSNRTPYSTQSLSRRLAPNSIGLEMSQMPTKMLLNTNRRSSSGIFITSLFGSRFRHLQKLHSEAFLGLNSICLPGLPNGAVFRSSLPATPVATPIHREAFQHFSEQILRDRLCRTPSPRKNRGFLNIGSQPTTDQQMRSDSSCSQSMAPNDESTDFQPMDITSPIDEPVIEVREDTKEEESDGSGHHFRTDDRLHRNPSDLFERRIFVGNISYRVKEWELSNFFLKFGRVYNCCIVKDHNLNRPKGYGFITFQKVSDCQSVLNADPNELILDNRQLRVFPSKPKTTSQMKKEIQEINVQRIESIEYRNTESMDHSIHYKKRTKLFSFNDLDDYVILQIFSNLDNLKDWTNIEMVCKRWQRLMTSLWLSQTQISFASTFLSFGGPVLDTSTLFSILKKCPNLRSIDLRNITNLLDMKALEIIAVSCPHLEDLYFDSGITTDYTLRILGEKCPELKCLNLNNCLKLREKGLWWLLKNCRLLETLDIRNNQNLNGNCFRLLTESLKSLDIRNCINIKNKGILELVYKNRKCLKCLSLSSMNYNIMKTIASNLKSLTTLRIIYSTQLNGNLKGFPLISELKNLEILENYFPFEDINDNSIILVIKFCTKIKELVLCLNSNVSDKSMVLIPQFLPNLHKLGATNSKITDESLVKWSTLNNLKNLDIRDSPLISDSGVNSLVIGIKSLLYLNINECQNISFDCIKYLMNIISFDDKYSELIIIFENIRINTKNYERIKEIEEIFERNSILSDDSDFVIQ